MALPPPRGRPGVARLGRTASTPMAFRLARQVGELPEQVRCERVLGYYAIQILHPVAPDATVRVGRRWSITATTARRSPRVHDDVVDVDRQRGVRSPANQAYPDGKRTRSGLG